MADPASSVRLPWRRFLRFSVRGLIVLVLVIGGCLGWIVRAHEFSARRSRNSRKQAPLWFMIGTGRTAVRFVESRGAPSGLSMPSVLTTSELSPMSGYFTRPTRCYFTQDSSARFKSRHRVSGGNHGRRFGPSEESDQAVETEPLQFPGLRRRNRASEGSHGPHRTQPERHSHHRLRSGKPKRFDQSLRLERPWYLRHQCRNGDLKRLTKLTKLDLNDTHITDAGLMHLESLTNLTELSVAPGLVTVTEILRSRRFTDPEEWSPYRIQVTDAGLLHFKGLINLSKLDLTGTRVTDVGLVQLKGLTRLSVLDLRVTHVTDAGVKDLQQALPTLKIIR